MLFQKSKNKVDVIFVKQTSEKWNAPSESEKKCETKISTCEIENYEMCKDLLPKSEICFFNIVKLK